MKPTPVIDACTWGGHAAGVRDRGNLVVGILLVGQLQRYERVHVRVTASVHGSEAMIRAMARARTSNCSTDLPVETHLRAPNRQPRSRMIGE
jgi:hypothetical protein